MKNNMIMDILLFVLVIIITMVAAITLANTLTAISILIPLIVSGITGLYAKYIYEDIEKRGKDLFEPIKTLISTELNKCADETGKARRKAINKILMLNQVDKEIRDAKNYFMKGCLNLIFCFACSVVFIVLLFYIFGLSSPNGLLNVVEIVIFLAAFLGGAKTYDLFKELWAIEQILIAKFNKEEKDLIIIVGKYFQGTYTIDLEDEE